MSVDRKFVDREAPLVVEAARMLANEFERCVSILTDTAGSGVISALMELEALSDHRVIVVVPGARAGRLLLAELGTYAESNNQLLLPPEIATPGQLYDSLVPYLGKLSPAQPLARTIAWEAVLREVPSELTLDFPVLDGEEVSERHLRGVAERIERLYSEMSGAGLSFEAVASLLDERSMDDEAERWSRLDELLQLHRQALESAGMYDTYERRLTDLGSLSIEGKVEVVLVGVPEMPAYVYGALEQLLATSEELKVTSVIYAEEALAHRFDEWGRPVIKEWSQAVLDLENNQIFQCQNPEQEAEAVAYWVGALAETCEHSIVVGCGSAELQNLAVQALDKRGVYAHPSEGVPLVTTPLWRALADLRLLFATRSMEAFAAVARNPYLEHMLMVPTAEEGETSALSSFRVREVLAEVDHWHNRSLPRRLPTETELAHRSLKEFQYIGGAFAALYTWLPELTRDQEPDSFAQQLRVVARIVDRVLSSATITDEPEVRKATAELLASMSSIAELFEIECTLGDLLGLLFTQARKISVPETQQDAFHQDGALEVVGWLELLHDPSKGVMLCGFNEGTLPGGKFHDPFLPESTKTELAAVVPYLCWTAEQRFARDVYLMDCLSRSRTEIRVSCAASSTDGQPLLPGRLLYRCKNQELPSRMQHLRTLTEVIPISLGESSATLSWEVPIPHPPHPKGEVLEKLSVTEVGAYLRSPYRYALRSKARKVDDRAAEVDPLQYGSLLHEVLERFALDAKLRDCTDEQLLAEGLLKLLRTAVEARFVLPNVRSPFFVQLEALKERLRLFAARQVAWISKGWRIAVEPELGILPEMRLSREMMVDGLPVRIEGRVDRIDYHQEQNRYVIFDYKTGDRATEPFKHHVRSSRVEPLERWKSVQLPLYEWMARDDQRFSSAELTTGYWWLPREGEVAGPQLTDWANELESACECTAQVIRLIRQGEFTHTEDDMLIADEVGLLAGYGQQVAREVDHAD